MARLRSPAQRAPQTREQALALLDRFAQRSAELAQLQAERQAALAATNAVADALIVPIDAELKDIVKQLKPWWAANVDTLTGGKRKSIELGGCLIGYRINPPSVKFAHGDDEAAAARLIDAELGALVRIKASPDKPAILKLLDGDAPEPLVALGFTAHQSETFFVDRLAPPALDRIVEAGAC